jgi:hypothetical protein
MEADTDAGDDSELNPPTSRYRRKRLKHRVAGGERCADTRPARILDPKPSHHPITSHVKHLAAKRHSNPRQNGEKFIEYRYDSRGWQLFGKTSVPPHIGE